MNRLNPESLENRQPDRSFSKAPAFYALLAVGALGAAVVIDKFSGDSDRSPDTTISTSKDSTGDETTPVHRTLVVVRPSPTAAILLARRFFPPTPNAQLRGSDRDERIFSPEVVRPSSLPAAPQIVESEMLPQEMETRNIYPYDSIHNLANCLQRGFQVAETGQTLAQRFFSLISSPFAVRVAEASAESMAPKDVVACLKNEPKIVEFVLRHRGVNLANIQESDVKGEILYKDLPKFLANFGMTLAVAQSIFGSKITMTFKDGDVVRWGTATMLDDKDEVERRRRTAGEKMIFWTGEAYEVVVKDGKVVVFRKDCANLIIFEVPIEVQQVPTPTKTFVSVVPPTNTPRPPDTATPVPPTETQVPPPPATPTRIPRPTIPPQPPLPTATLGVGPIETAQPVATRIPTNTPITPVAPIQAKPTIKPQGPTPLPTATRAPAAPATETPQSVVARISTSTPPAPAKVVNTSVNTPRPTIAPGKP